MTRKRTPIPKSAGVKPALKGKLASPREELFDRVVGILELARTGVVRAVNSHMVTAYWLIGREILHEVQGGTARAKYGGLFFPSYPRN